MTTNYEVIDNALNKKDSDLIKDIMMSSRFPWHYSRIVDKEYRPDQYYFVHHFFGNFSWQSGWAEQIIQPILSVIKPLSIMRIKGNFYPQSSKQIENDKHMDYPFEHKGAIYYVNTNDGFTILEDNTKIESVQNRILLFDPSKLHGSTHCTDDHGRVNINFNFF